MEEEEWTAANIHSVSFVDDENIWESESSAQLFDNTKK